MSNYYLTKEDCLKHYGTPGMKWYHRLYQNADGTYTELGKARRRLGDSEQGQKRKESLFKAGKDGKPSKAEKLTRSASEVVSGAQRLRGAKKTKAVDSKVAEKTKDISKMSNRELQEYVNRYNLEQQYKNVLRQQETAKIGKSKVDQFLEIGGAALSAASSAATILAILWQLKNGS